MTKNKWTRTENTKNSVVYKNYEDENEYVTLEYMNFKNRMLWKVRTFSVAQEYFKKKENALKYAKQYMKKH